jgi:hypothetical protein
VLNSQSAMSDQIEQEKTSKQDEKSSKRNLINVRVFSQKHKELLSFLEQE